MSTRALTMVGLLAALLLGGCSAITNFENDKVVGWDGGANNNNTNANTNNNNNVIVHPSCHNGVVEDQEQCDDNNGDPWDGCHECNIAEFQVNDITQGDQETPAVAAVPGLGFLVVWHGPDGNGYHDIFGKLYAEDGTVALGEFDINTTQENDQSTPAVSSSGRGAGTFVAVWLSDHHMGPEDGIHGQRIGSSGHVGSQFRVSEQEGGVAMPAVAERGTHGFVATWTHQENNAEIVGRLFQSDGTPDGSDFTINETTAGDQMAPSVASDNDGEFMVVWHGTGVDGFDIFGRYFWSDGVAEGGEFTISTHNTNGQMMPYVAMDPAGRSVVFWDSDHATPGSGVVFGQRFSDQHAPASGEFELYPGQSLRSWGARAVMHDDESFTVFWTAEQSSDVNVFGRRYNFNGAPDGDITRINAHDFGNPQQITAARYGTTTVVCWTTEGGQDGDARGIFCRRFTRMLEPIPLGTISLP